MTTTTTDAEILGNIASNLKRLRGERTLAEVARAAGTYAANVGRIESQENMPSAGLLSRIAEALGTTPLGLLDPPPPSKPR